MASALGEVLNELLDRGANGITSARELAARLAELKGTSREGERKSIRRHIKTGRAEEATIQKYAEAFGVDRSVFPEASTRVGSGASAAAIRELQSQVATLQDQVDEIRRRLPDPEQPGATMP